MTIIFELKNKLQKQNISLNKPATWQEVLAFEYKYQLRLSPILRNYFLEFNGTGEGNMADDYFSFFSLAQFRLVESISNSNSDKILYSNCFVFSDYLVWCWGYAVELDQIGSDGVVYQVAGTPKRKVADSFTEFLKLYLIDSEGIL
ncbi:SMI1/KNR4 family protein [Acinetobacter haemolyticus]|uniref:SMI1 / KNR4 family protein n=1 Tax=Acinetobacter haemolyticus ATCC 19194 TaxID=707232 RepID=D4XP21_ACIHA|nr:SMI1/KNR4 family protein [Acinetobacter haemolyticus]EFF83031.1 SMI1 / KNR4 family protein [Acinetobacter haemolyticus ATCC 19194]WPO66419.1 SMI1/KNR4 family protein [Acinetobacter haemolyticus]